VRCERRAESSATIEDDLRSVIRNRLFDVPFQDSPADVNGTHQAVGRELALLPDVDQKELLPPLQLTADILHGQLPYPRPGLGNDLQETGRMGVSHVLLIT